MTHTYNELESSREQIQMGITDARIGIIGLGNIGLPMAQGLLHSGAIVDSQLLLSNRNGEVTKQRVVQLTGYTESMIAQDNDQVVRSSDIVFIALKQAQMRDELSRWGESNLLQTDQLVVSFAAGVRIDTIKKWLGNNKQAVARGMPNTPVAVGRGVFGWTVSDEVTKGQFRQLQRLLSAVGTEIYVDSEESIDTVTAISGSGPAYFYFLAEQMVKSGIKLGMSQQQADKLVSETLIGAAQLFDSSGTTPTVLRQRITSKGGTTEAAIASFTKNQFDTIVQMAIVAAKERAKQLGDHFDSL